MTFMIVTLGDLVVDIVAAVQFLPMQPNQYQEAHFVRMEPGGAGNFLITGSRLGMHMVSVGALGDDAFGRDVAATLMAEGVDMALVDHPVGTTTTAVVVLNDDHGKTVMTGAYGAGAMLTFRPEWDTALHKANAIFTFGYSLRERRIQGAVLEGMERARAIGRPVFFDPGPEFHLLHEAARARALAATDILLLTEDEVAQTGVRTAFDLLQHSKVVVVKRGADGCQVWTREGKTDVPGFPVLACDVAGAGDCFAAAFVYGYLSGWSLERAAVFANATGAAKVQKRGTGRQSPTANEVRAVLVTYQSDVTF